MTGGPDSQPGVPPELLSSLFGHFERQPGSGLLTLDAQGRVLWASANGLSLLAAPLEGVRGRTLESLLHEDDRLGLPRDFMPRSRAGHTTRLESRLDRSGAPLWCEITVLPVQGESGALTLLQDISPRRAAEYQARSLEARRQALLDIALDAIITIDRHGRVMVWNRAATRIFGYSEKEAVNRPLTELIVPPQSHAGHLRGMTRHQQTGETRVSGRRIEIVARRKDGSAVEVEMTMSPVWIEEQLYYTAFIHDLTGHRQAQVQLREQSEHLSLAHDQLPTLSWTTDRDLTVTMLRGGALAGLNLEPSVLVGRTIAGVLSGVAQEQEALEAHREALEGRRSRYLHRFLEQVFEVHISPLQGAAGEVTGTVALATDVTEQHREQVSERYRARVLRSIAIGEPLPGTLSLIAELLTQQTNRTTVQLLTVHGGWLRAVPGQTLPPGLQAVFSRPARPADLHPAWVRVLNGQDLTVSGLGDEGGWTPFRLAATQLGVRSLWLLPVLSRTGEVIGVIALYRAAPDGPSARLVDLIEHSAQLMMVAVEQDQYLQTILRTREETLRTLGVALEFRDYETKGHTDRVVALSLELAGRLGLSATQKEELRHGAYLHDLGKIAIPDQILLKPGKPDAAEWEIIRQHPVVGYEMLRHTPALGPASLEVVLRHHEHWNGGGYPGGLAGTDIPLLARVFAVVDTFDALTSARPYKRAWTEADALAELARMAGGVLDPHLVEVFTAWRAERAGQTGRAEDGVDGHV